MKQDTLKKVRHSANYNKGSFQLDINNVTGVLL